MACSEDRGRNTQKALRYIEHAVESDAQILCFPQLFYLPWFLNAEDPEALNLATSIEGEVLSPFRQAAQKHDVVLICPFFEKLGEKTYSSAAVFDTDGSVSGIYQKVHIPDIPGWKEKFYFAPGDQGFPVFETRRGRIGVQLCWDNFFPEGSRTLALKGAEILFAPTSAAYASQERWINVISANAFVNNLFVFRVNRVGHDNGLDFYGHSFCVNPYGDFVAEPVGMQESIVLADVNLSMVSEAREQTGFFRDRQGPLYEDLLASEGRDVP
jgi:N-carbamoylputrescine amidase